MYKLRKILTYLIIIILGIGVFAEKPTAFFLIGFWSTLIALALFKNYYRLLNVVAPDYPLEKIKEEGKLTRHIRAGFFSGFMFFIFGVLVSLDIL